MCDLAPVSYSSLLNMRPEYYGSYQEFYRENLDERIPNVYP
jgi:hypothetical protein